MQIARDPLVAGLLLASISSLGFALHRTGALPVEAIERAERAALDVRFRLRGPEPPGDDVVIIGFDDETLARAPLLFERRTGWARVIQAAHDAGARAIGIDALFSSPEQLLSAGLLDALRTQLGGDGIEGPPEPTQGLLDWVLEEVRGDARLEEVLAGSGRVTLGVHFGQKGGTPADAAWFSSGTYGQVVPGPHLPAEAGEARTSLPRFNKSAAGLGLITVLEDPDGRVRALPVARRVGTRVIAPLSVQLVARHLGVPRAQVAFRGTDGAVIIGDLVQEAPDGVLVLNYRGPARTFPTFSALDLVEGRLPEDALEGRVVLIGINHLVEDHVATPFGARFAGVELHATAIDNLLREDVIRRAPPFVDALLCLLAGLAMAALFWGRLRLGPAAQLLGALSVVAGVATLSYAAFALLDVWIFTSGPLAVQSAVLLGSLGVAYLGEGLKRRELRRTFAHYLSDQVIEELVEDPSRVSLRGERRELTVLFSDIRSFTTLSERLPPLQLAEILNRYFTPMTRAVLENGGFLDKYIGDALMAVFGAPVHHSGHAAEGCQAALAMHRALLELRPALEARGVALDIGVGLNTGEMVVGNMGSAERFDYTVLGDAVNLASRVESLTKGYEVFCLVGEGTERAARDRFAFRTVDLVRVKGKERPAEVFELLGGPSHDIVRYRQLPLYDAGVLAYRAGDLAEAEVSLRAYLDANPEDPVARLYLERLAALGGTAPPGWDGVFIHETK